MSNFLRSRLPVRRHPQRVEGERAGSTLDKSESVAEQTNKEGESLKNDSQDVIEALDEDVQRGVKAAEAITLNWSRRTLIFVFVK